MSNEKLWNFHEKNIRWSLPESKIINAKLCLTTVTKKTRSAIKCRNRKIYLRSRALKHLYDRKPAEEFDFIINHLNLIIRNPDALYANKIDKAGDFCLVRKIGPYRYIAVIEISREVGSEEPQIVTAFRIRNEKYLRNYDLLRSWRDGAHSS